MEQAERQTEINSMARGDIVAIRVVRLLNGDEDKDKKPDEGGDTDGNNGETDDREGGNKTTNPHF